MGISRAHLVRFPANRVEASRPGSPSLRRLHKYHTRLLAVPDKARLRREHVEQFYANEPEPTEAESMVLDDIIARMDSSKALYADIKYRCQRNPVVKWKELHAPPRASPRNLTGPGAKMAVVCPEIIVTTPEGETRWLMIPTAMAIIEIVFTAGRKTGPTYTWAWSSYRFHRRSFGFLDLLPTQCGHLLPNVSRGA